VNLFLEWIGTVDDISFVLSVSSCDKGERFTGLVSYPLLGAAKLRVNGKIKGFTIEYDFVCCLYQLNQSNKRYSEDSCLFSDDFVAVGGVYKLKLLSSNFAEGICTFQDNATSQVFIFFFFFVVNFFSFFFS
jgi:hypothetical protein